jgi:Na+-driven multidrug efflux pump
MKRTIASQLRDLAVYVGVGVAMLVGVWGLVAYDTGRGAPSNPARVNWLSLGFVTCIVYINAIHEGRRFRRRPRFWTGLGIALLVQVVGAVVVLWNAPRVPVFIWTIAALANMAVVGGFMHWWLRSGLVSRKAAGGPTSGCS